MEAIDIRSLIQEEVRKYVASTGGVHMSVIPEGNGLDRIEVFWVDYEPSRGSVTITCWGSAWTVYFGVMSGRTIRKFFADCSTDYLVTKLGITQWLKQNKAH